MLLNCAVSFLMCANKLITVDGYKSQRTPTKASAYPVSECMLQ